MENYMKNFCCCELNKKWERPILHKFSIECPMAFVYQLKLFWKPIGLDNFFAVNVNYIFQKMVSLSVFYAAITSISTTS